MNHYFTIICFGVLLNSIWYGEQAYAMDSNRRTIRLHQRSLRVKNDSNKTRKLYGRSAQRLHLSKEKSLYIFNKGLKNQQKSYFYNGWVQEIMRKRQIQKDSDLVRFFILDTVAAGDYATLKKIMLGTCWGKSYAPTILERTLHRISEKNGEKFLSLLPLLDRKYEKDLYLNAIYKFIEGTKYNVARALITYCCSSHPENPFSSQEWKMFKKFSYCIEFEQWLDTYKKMHIKD